MSLPSIPDYSNAIETPVLIHPPMLHGGHPVKKGTRLVRYSGGFCVVYPYETTTGKYAVRCWHAEVADAKKRTQIIAKALKNSKLPYFVGFEYCENGIMTAQGMQPVVVMDWVDALNLKKFIAAHLDEPDTLNRVAENFKQMVSDLHRHHFSHGDLQHGNILVRPDLSLVLVDYDSMYTPDLAGMTDEIKGLVGYQHKARWKNKFVSEKADYFSELVIYLTLRALARHNSLWHELRMEDTETLLFTSDDLESNATTPIFSTLRSDAELSPMVDKMCCFLQKDSIDELEPLESYLISSVEKIASKWKGGNGVSRTSQVSSIVSSATISGKWSSGRDDVEASRRKNQKCLSDSISEKFKKQ